MGTINNVERKELRKKYLDGVISHEEFYLWTAEKLGYDAVVRLLPVSIERIKRSTDPHLNDISLSSWGREHESVELLAWKHDNRFDWSLSDTVCVLKAVAKAEATKS